MNIEKKMKEVVRLVEGRTFNPGWIHLTYDSIQGFDATAFGVNRDDTKLLAKTDFHDSPAAALDSLIKKLEADNGR